MKQLASTAASAMAALSVYAQGTVDFQNLGAPPGICKFGAPVTAADGILAQLYWSTTQDGLYMPAGAPTPIGDVEGTDLPGYFHGGVVLIEGITPPGDIAFFEVRAWEAAFGSTFEAAAAAPPMGGRVALRGVSVSFALDTGDPLNSPPDISPDIGSFMPIFSITAGMPCIPEPSVIALGIIGAGLLLMLRRRT